MAVGMGSGGSEELSLGDLYGAICNQSTTPTYYIGPL